MIGDARLVAIDAAGHGEHAAPGTGADLVQVVGGGLGQGGEGGHREFAHAVRQQGRGRVRIGQGEAGIGAADVGHQQCIAHAQLLRAGRPTASNCAGRKCAASRGPWVPAG